MQGKNVIFSLCLILVVLAIVISRIQHEPKRKEAFDRAAPNITTSKYVVCRMQCQQITKADIEEIMIKGIINFSKSNRQNKPCPLFALQGSTSKGESLRILFAQCPGETTILNCYNLRKNSDCNCPADSLQARIPF